MNEYAGRALAALDSDLNTQALSSPIALARRGTFDWTIVVSATFVALLALLVLLPMGWLAISALFPQKRHVPSMEQSAAR